MLDLALGFALGWSALILGGIGIYEFVQWRAHCRRIARRLKDAEGA